MYSLPGEEDEIRRKVYRSIHGTPSPESREVGLRELDAKLRNFVYQGEALPKVLELSERTPVIDYFKQFPGSTF